MNLFVNADQGDISRSGATFFSPPSRQADFRALNGAPIGALPRNRLAASATGGASAVSPGGKEKRTRPHFSLGLSEKNGVARQKEIAFAAVRRYTFIWRFGIDKELSKDE